jgi:hypothetical protein
MSVHLSSSFPPGIESGRIGMQRAVDMQNRAAQEVAEAGIYGMNEDFVSLSDTALGLDTGRPSVENGLIDAQVAQYLALANAKVVRTSADTAKSLMDILGH